MHQVFISYNNADRRLVDELSRAWKAPVTTPGFYDRDSRVGFNYMDYVGALISECQAMVLLISPLSVESQQVTREVIRACEENKFVLPVLCGMTYAQFQKLASHLAPGAGGNRGTGVAAARHFGHLAAPG